MTIRLPEHLESPILAAIDSGRYASLEDAMAEAANLLVQRLKQEQEEASAQAPLEQAMPPHRPIWEVVDQLRKDVPPEELAELPRDGAEQLDHYLHGSPKRPTS